ncbi:MAG: SUMF1/EgtB/PvdO family nonheme iron enzyme [Treponema sp.]|jgi:formylglycine-generating enzyme required for sulfatase activity|nr:SUMF1/EgtB/PvdO family nonheme iron enzyme [Treponema sp.]
MKNVRKIAGAGIALLTALCVMTLCVMACENPAGNDDVAVSGVSLNKTTLTVGVGGTETLTATVAPADATNKNVTWASSDTTKAIVSAAGLVTGVAVGTATITVTTVDGNKTASCAVTIPLSAGVLSTHTLSGISVPFRYVPAGSFQRDGTAANVSIITGGYWMGETEVTQELFQAVMGINPSSFTSGAAAGETQNRRPVEQVNWYDAIAFCNKLSIAAGKEPVYSVSGVSDWAALAYSSIPTSDDSTWDAATWDKSTNGYRLPTEMEWMWAAMGADTSVQPNITGYDKAFAGSTGSNSIDEYAWYDTNSDSKTHEVGKKNANELELKDMSGNVFEWCWDWHDSYPAEGTTDYTGAASGAARVIRGGSWSNYASICAVSCRVNTYPDNRFDDLGFRVVCP